MLGQPRQGCHHVPAGLFEQVSQAALAQPRQVVAQHGHAGLNALCCRHLWSWLLLDLHTA